MNTELEVLKKILKGRDKSSIKSIANHLGFGIDYIRFICKKLEEKDLIKELSRDWYKITPKGERELAKRGLIKKPLQKKSLKIENPAWKTVRMKSLPTVQVSKNIKLRPNLEKIEEEKLKIGKKIEKAAAFLQNFTQ